jgi:hypothetical protein
MSERNKNEEGRNPMGLTGLSRRALLRNAGLVGVGALGAGLAGCKGRPEDQFVDTGTDPSVLQVGGTLSGQLIGLLTGAVGAGLTVRLLGLGEVQADDQGRFEVRVAQEGDFVTQIYGDGFQRRTGMTRIAGNVVLTERLLESDAGLSANYVNEYARGAGSGKEGVTPRTPGATNRWLSAPTVRIYRQLSDDDKRVVPDARVDAMQASIQALFGPLTGNALGFGVNVEVRRGAPPTDLVDVPRDTIVVAQTRNENLSLQHTGTLDNPWAISKARTSCRVDSTIELFNRMFAHALGAWVVTAGNSVVNPAGAAAPSDRDLQAASFLYSRVAGNRAPDEDPPGAFLNA